MYLDTCTQPPVGRSPLQAQPGREQYPTSELKAVLKAGRQWQDFSHVAVNRLRAFQAGAQSSVHYSGWGSDTAFLCMPLAAAGLCLPWARLNVLNCLLGGIYLPAVGSHHCSTHHLPLVGPWWGVLGPERPLI